MKNKAILLAGIFTLTVASAQNSSPGFFGMKPGSNDQVSGSASEKEGAKNAAPKLEKCERPLGTIAVVQPQDFMMQALNKYNLPAPSNLLRLMIQQSGCFQVVERGLGMQNMMQERQMQQGGQLQSNSNVGGGQMVSADFIMTPEVQFSENKTGGAGMLGGMGALFGPIGMIAGEVASNLKFSQASTTLIVADARSGIQIAAASGSAELGAYGNTPEGQIVAAAMLNNYNEIVGVVRNQKSIVAPTAAPVVAQNAANSVQAGAVFNSGDTLSPKIPGVKIFESALNTSKVVAPLKRDDQVVYLGEEAKDFLKVQGADGEGWVDKKLMKK